MADHRSVILPLEADAVLRLVPLAASNLGLHLSAPEVTEGDSWRLSISGARLPPHPAWVVVERRTPLWTAVQMKVAGTGALELVERFLRALVSCVQAAR